MTFTIDFAVIVTLFGLLISVASFFIGRTTAAKKDGKEAGQILTELGYLKSNTDDIKRRLDDQDKRYIELAIKIAGIERDMKTAFNRIDELKGVAK